MQCEEFEIRLNEALDRRLPLTSADALDHQQVCSSCRERSAAYAAIARQMAVATSPALPAELTERVLAELRRPATVPLARRRRPSLTLAAAAVFVVCVVSAWSLNRSGFITPAAPRQMAGRTNETKAKRQEAVSPVQTTIARRKKVAPAVRGPATNETENEIVSALPDAAAVPAAEWAQQVADGLQPVTRPTLGAATGFLQVWGVGQKRSPSKQEPRS